MSENAGRPVVKRDANPNDVLERLQEHLHNSFNRIERNKKCAVLFSGGVDSSLAAILTKKQCDDTLLVTARCDDSHDAQAAVRAANTMSIDITEVRIDSESLWEILPDVVRSIGRSSRMDVEIAIPFFFAAREARNLGYDLMVSGQGPDELFGGYARYEKIMIEKGPEEVEAALWRDFSITDELNIQRDTRVMMYHRLQPFFPYFYPDFVSTALSIPAAMNIDPNKKPARKLMFRELALMMGVPKEVALEKKRATQYSSGTSKMLIESIRNHTDDSGIYSKKEILNLVQDILDRIILQQSKEE